ncbi:MAG: zinc-binding alcohol dehydrogenase [Candidatus Latescibacterota bacterium]
MPRQLIAPTREQAAFQEYESPTLDTGQVRVKSLFAAAKHGTEMSQFKGYASPRGGFDRELRVFDYNGEGVKYPVLLGNMGVGEVIELGPGVTRLKEGDQVFNYGPFREEHVWPETVRTLPKGVPWQAAVCLDPADFALSAVRDGNVRIGDAVAVSGMGAISLLVLQFCRLAGAHPIIAVDPLENRRQAALACGADVVLDPSQCDAGIDIKKATGNRGADVVIDYSGHPAALQQALRGIAYLGTVVCGAYPGAWPTGLDLGAEAHMNRPNIIFSRANSDPNPDHPNWDNDRIYDVCWRLLRTGQIHCEVIVDPIVPFDDLVEEYPKIASQPQANIKLGARF